MSSVLKIISLPSDKSHVLKHTFITKSVTKNEIINILTKYHAR